MRTNPTIKLFLILGILFMATYALADGIRYRSVAGIIMAIASLFALFVVVMLSRKLARLKEEELQEGEEESIS